MVEPFALGGSSRRFPAHGVARPFALLSAVTATSAVQGCGDRRVGEETVASPGRR